MHLSDLPLLLVHIRFNQVEHTFVYTLGLCSTSFSTYNTTQGCTRKGHVFTFPPAGWWNIAWARMLHRVNWIDNDYKCRNSSVSSSIHFHICISCSVLIHLLLEQKAALVPTNKCRVQPYLRTNQTCSINPLYLLIFRQVTSLHAFNKSLARRRFTGPYLLQVRLLRAPPITSKYFSQKEVFWLTSMFTKFSYNE